MRMEVKTEEGPSLVTGRNHTGAEKEYKVPDSTAVTQKNLNSFAYL